MSEWYLQKASVEELDSLLHIAISTFREAFEHQNKKEDFEAYIREFLNRETLCNELSNPNSQFYFAYNEANIIGYIKLNFYEAQTEKMGNTAMELQRIYVVSEYQGSGIGSWLLNQCFEIAAQRNLRIIWLGVWEKNTSAIRFYERHGFEIFDKHSFMIGTDQQIDYLMRRNV